MGKLGIYTMKAQETLMPCEQYYKDNTGYIAPLSEWCDMFNDAREEQPHACFENSCVEEYICSLTPVTKVAGEWLELDK